MRIDLFKKDVGRVDLELDPAPLLRVTRAEIRPFKTVGGQYTVVILDAEDTFDIIIEDPDGGREGIYSLVKEPE